MLNSCCLSRAKIRRDISIAAKCWGEIICHRRCFLWQMNIMHFSTLCFPNSFIRCSNKTWALHLLSVTFSEAVMFLRTEGVSLSWAMISFAHTNPWVQMVYTSDWELVRKCVSWKVHRAKMIARWLQNVLSVNTLICSVSTRFELEDCGLNYTASLWPPQRFAEDIWIPRAI